jgi:F-type H+-transporting ATPase subunit b
MPQFNPTYFPTQIFWLAVCFVVLYVLMARIALPRVGQALDERRNRIDDDLDKAEQLKKEAADVLAAYERTMADARSRAQLLLKTMADRTAADSAAKQAALARRMADETKAAEARIAAAKEKALGEIRSIAATAAEAAADRLIGAAPARAQVEEAVDKALSERT